jgi:hypothetical protein
MMMIKMVEMLVVTLSWNFVERRLNLRNCWRIYFEELDYSMLCYLLCYGGNCARIRVFW